jgi:hypothetical protein
VVVGIVLVGSGATGTDKQAGAADDERHAAGGDKPPRHAGTILLHDVGRVIGVLFAVKLGSPAT